MDYKEYCIESYNRIYQEEYSNHSSSQDDDKRRHAQKFAMRQATIQALSKFPDVEPYLIWKTIYVAHVHNYSGISDQKAISSVISADNSWKKSSGHAFEEIISELGNKQLNKSGIEVYLQKDLNTMMKESKIHNDQRDLDWLWDQIGTSIFDLYLVVISDNKRFVFGCVQSKTSVRDRVTRDREPSIKAMNKFFFSVAVVLDGAFLKMPKFINMVNGNSKEYVVNGWHALYVFSNEDINNDRIHCVGPDMDRFVDDAKKAAQFWLDQRQWIHPDWRP